MPWGVVFPGSGHAVHPVQLYLGAGLGALFLFLWRWHPPKLGRRFLVTIGLYCTVNLIFNLYRIETTLEVQAFYAVVAVLTITSSVSIRGESHAKLEAL